LDSLFSYCLIPSLAALNKTKTKTKTKQKKKKNISLAVSRTS